MKSCLITEESCFVTLLGWYSKILFHFEIRQKLQIKNQTLLQKAAPFTRTTHESSSPHFATLMNKMLT